MDDISKEVADLVASRTEPVGKTAEELAAEQSAAENQRKEAEAAEQARIAQEAGDPEKKETPPAPVASKKLKEIFNDVEDYKDKEDDFIVTDFKSRLAKQKEIEENYQKVQEQLKSVVSPFASEQEHRAYILRQKFPSINLDTASKLVSAEEVAKIDDVEALVLKAVIDDPDTNPEMEKKLILREHKVKPLTDEQKEDMTPEQIQEYEENAEIKAAILAKKAKTAKREMAEMAAKIDLPKVMSEADRKVASEKFETTMKQGWTGVTDSLLKETKTFDIPIESEDGKFETIAQIEISEEVKKQLREIGINTMVANRFSKFDEQEAKSLQAVIQNSYIVSNLPKIIKSACEKYHSDKIAEMNNAGLPDKNKKTGVETKEEGSIDERQNAINARLNKRS